MCQSKILGLCKYYIKSLWYVIIIQAFLQKYLSLIFINLTSFFLGNFFWDEETNFCSKLQNPDEDM